jgi:hypothetical protein
MAKLITIPLVLPTSVAAGAAIDTSTFGHKTVYVKGAFTGTYQIQVSDDNVTFINYGTALTAAGVLEITAEAPFVRANCTAYTSGTPTASVVGLYATQGG